MGNENINSLPKFYKMWQYKFCKPGDTSGLQQEAAQVKQMHIQTTMAGY
jgi:hypothetical protein